MSVMNEHELTVDDEYLCEHKLLNCRTQIQLL